VGLEEQAMVKHQLSEAQGQNDSFAVLIPQFWCNCETIETFLQLETKFTMFRIFVAICGMSSDRVVKWGLKKSTVKIDQTGVLPKYHHQN
jgi:hypothetical protein